VAPVAVQTGAEPTNKVAAATNAAGGIAGIVAGTLAAYGGPAIVEFLGAWATTHPAGTQLVVLLVTGVAAGIATKYAGRSASYNVLDAPNVPMAPVASPTAADIR
jgi:hypothetical protein